MLSIQLKDFWTMAAKAVKAYANKKFAGFFQEADVEDIVAEVVTNLDETDKGSEFGWVWTIAKNAVRDAAIAKRNRKDIGGWDDSVAEEAEGLVGDDRADRELLQDELVESLYDHLRQERDKRILLYLADGLEYEEIAEREGLTMRATYMAVFHMRRRLNNDAA